MTALPRFRNFQSLHRRIRRLREEIQDLGRQQLGMLWVMSENSPPTHVKIYSLFNDLESVRQIVVKVSVLPTSLVPWHSVLSKLRTVLYPAYINTSGMGPQGTSASYWHPVGLLGYGERGCTLHCQRAVFETYACSGALSSS